MSGVLRRMARREQDRLRREWERAVRAAGADPLLWDIHFGSVLPGCARCRDCLDYRLGLCAGGRDPVVCMRHSHRNLEALSVEGNP